MSTSAVSSSSGGVRPEWQRVHEFRSGRVNISKDDLQQASNQLKEAGRDTTRVDDLIGKYDTVDTNGDGISFDEFKTYSKDMKLYGFHGERGRYGSKEDGPPEMTADQLSSLRDKLQKNGETTDTLDAVIGNFSTADTDGNGALSLDELNSYAESNGLALPERPQHGRPPGGMPPALSQDELTKLRDKLQADGQSTELLDSVLANYSTADANGDGDMSRDEMKSYADSQGISLPTPPSGNPKGAVSTDTAVSQASATATEGSTSNVELVKMLLARFDENSYSAGLLSTLTSVVA